MKTLLISLGDIHLNQNSYEDIIYKKDKLAEFLKWKAEQNKVHDILLLCNGDIVNKGKDEEFYYAIEFFDELDNKLRESNNEITISYIFSPGNHDVNLDTQTSLQKKEISNLSQKIEKGESNIRYDLFETNYEALKNYNNFVSLFEHKDKVASNVFFDHYKMKFDNKQIEILSLNGSLFFTGEFSQGRILIDSDYILRNLETDNNSLKILMSHYPPEWYKRGDKRYFDDLANHFNILIFGHEHTTDYKEISKIRDDYYEFRIPAFNSAYTKKNTGFFSLVIDTEKETAKVEPYIYEENTFQKEEDKTKIINLREFSSNSNELFSIKNEMQEYLEKSDELVSSLGEPIKLNNIFTDPRLSIISGNDKSETHDSVEGEDEFNSYVLFSELTFESASFFAFYGDNSTGKTAILKRIFTHLFQKDFVPVLLNGHDIKNKLTQERLTSIIDKQFKKQYANPVEKLYENKDRLCVLIDDIHLVQNYDVKKANIETIYDFANKTIISASRDYAIFDDDIIDAFNPHKFIIQNFGQTQIYDLTEKWMEAEGVKDRENNHQILVDIKSQINRVSSNGMVPLTPFYITLLLRAFFEEQSERLLDSSKTVYYQFIINKIILQVSELTELQPNKIDSALREIAYLLFIDEELSWKDICERIYENYPFSKDEKIVLDHKLKQVLMNNGLLHFSGNKNIGFKHNYMYYYFLSHYFSLNFEDHKDTIKRMVRQLYKEKYANTLIFLSQLTNQSYLHELIIEEANKIFKEYREINLDEDMEVYNLFIKGVRDVERYGDLKTNNQKLNKKVDKKNDEKSEDNNVDEDDLTEVQKNIVKSAKVLKILNELINQFGRMDKMENLTLTSIKLGKRVLSKFTEEHTLKIIDFARKQKKDEDAIDQDEFIEHIKTSSQTFANILLFTVWHLGSKNNLRVINSITERKKTNNNFMLKFLFNIKYNPDDDLKIDMEEVRRYVRSFETSKNHYCKALVNSTLSYYMNYVGLPTKKIVEIGDHLGYTKDKKKKLLALNN